MDLKKIFGEELASQVEEKLGDKYLVVEEANHVTKTSFNGARDELKSKIELLESQLGEAQTQLSEKNTQLEQIKNDTQTSEELKTKIEQMQQENETKINEYKTKLEQEQQEWEQKLTQQKLDSKLELALRDAKAKNVKAVMALLNTDDIKLDGDNLIGLDDQLTKIKEENDYLFGSATLKGKEPNNDGSTPESKTFTKEQVAKMTPDEINSNWEAIQASGVL